jgi:DNA mismatch endonuclease, patch repair protein
MRTIFTNPLGFPSHTRRLTHCDRPFGRAWRLHRQLDLGWAMPVMLWPADTVFLLVPREPGAGGWSGRSEPIKWISRRLWAMQCRSCRCFGVVCVRGRNPMTDHISREQRSVLMGRVSGKDTKPELQVRAFLHARGFRYRLHRRDLPGKPDIALPRYRTVVFVHGCFWHSHRLCRRATLPRTNTAFWTKKIHGNVLRDRRAATALRRMGWSVLTVWGCEAGDSNAVACRLRTLLRRKVN